jgi:hypothetical protein
LERVAVLVIVSPCHFDRREKLLLPAPFLLLLIAERIFEQLPLPARSRFLPLVGMKRAAVQKGKRVGGAE